MGPGGGGWVSGGCAPAPGSSWEGAQDPTTRLEGGLEVQPLRAPEVTRAGIKALVAAQSPEDAPVVLRAALMALADGAVSMAAGMREHIAMDRPLDAWAAADWLADLSQQVKDALPCSSSDIIRAVEEGGAPQLRDLLRQQQQEGGQGESPTHQPGD